MKKWILIVFNLLILTSLSIAQMESVDMLAGSFSPADITITEGTTVTWNNATADLIHTSTSGTGCAGDGTWDSGNVNPGGSFSMTFASGSNGVYPYFCIPHCAAGMTGTVTVEVSSATSDPDREYDLIEVYPNPFTDKVTVVTHFTFPQDLSVNIYDISGNVVLSKEGEATLEGKQQFTLSTNDLRSGTYILQIDDEKNFRVTHKITKVH